MEPPWLVEIRLLRARRRGKAARMGLSITQCLPTSSREQGSLEPLAAEPSWLGGSGFPQKPRSGLAAGLMEPGNFKEETNPNCY